MTAYVLVTAPTSEPISRAEAKTFLRVDHTVEDSLIDALIKAAREYTETFTRRQLMTQEWSLYLDSFPDTIQIEKAPVTSIDAVKYIDTSGTTRTLTGNTDYTVDLKSLHPRVMPAYGKSWPSTRSVMNAVQVDFTVGYADAAAVPAAIKQAMLLLIGTWYDHREEVIASIAGGEVMPRNLAADALLWSYRVLTA